MQLKTSHLIWALVALVVAGNGDRIANSLEQSAAQQADRAEAGSERRLLRQQAREAQKNSAIALARAKAGCIRIHDQATGKEHYFGNGSTVTDPNTGYALQEGIVCNSLGLTGVLVNGQITDLVMVSAADKVTYLGYLSLQKGEN